MRMTYISHSPLYSIDEAGNVWSLGYVLKPRINNAGYYRVRLNYFGKAKEHLVHRLVAEAFLPNPHNKPTVNHKDGNKQNNHVSNLEWCTRSEQMIHYHQSKL